MASTATCASPPATTIPGSRPRAAAAKGLPGPTDRLRAPRRVFLAKPLQFKASDGARVDGWGLIPSGRPKGGRPAVLAIHGGPKTAYGASFLLEFQILAGAGIAVLYSNPRGSDGGGGERGHAGPGPSGVREG